MASVGKPVRRLVKATAKLQKVLGEHQDACVGKRRVRELVDSMGDMVDVDVVFVAGRLVEREEARRAEARAAWPKAWRRVSPPGPVVGTGLIAVTGRDRADPRPRQPARR